MTTQQTSVQRIVNAIELAQSKGCYSLEQAATLYTIINSLKEVELITKTDLENLVNERGELAKLLNDYKETIELDLTNIELKNHGSNNSNSIIFSKHINEIAYAIHNSKTILLDAINSNYCSIVNEFSILNKKNNNLSCISRFISLVDVCHNKAYNANKYNYNKQISF